MRSRSSLASYVRASTAGSTCGSLRTRTSIHAAAALSSTPARSTMRSMYCRLTSRSARTLTPRRSLGERVVAGGHREGLAHVAAHVRALRLPRSRERPLGEEPGEDEAHERDRRRHHEHCGERFCEGAGRRGARGGRHGGQRFRRQRAGGGGDRARRRPAEAARGWRRAARRRSRRAPRYRASRRSGGRRRARVATPRSR